MTDMDIGNSTASDLTNAMTDYSVDNQTTDGAGDQFETNWDNSKWSQYFGYYSEIPELRAVIDAKATWILGKGVQADPDDRLTLDQINGWGKDTFEEIIENLIRDMQIGGDGFAEIIRNSDGEFINLKPLDPSSITIVVNAQGRLKRYEQNSKVKGSKPKKFKKEKIFHLARNRVADNQHGTSMIKALEWIILAKNEAMADWKRVLHRNVDPVLLIKLDTDNPTKIAQVKAKIDGARGAGENMYIPQGTIEVDNLATAPNATLNPLPWIELLDNKFYEAANCPKIIVGGAGGLTEAAVKIAYLAFENIVRTEQGSVVQQIGQQLGMTVTLEINASLRNELLSDESKDVESGAVQPNEVTAGVGQ